MTGAILCNAERDRETAALAQTESYAQSKARRRAGRIAEKAAARELVRRDSPSPGHDEPTRRLEPSKW